MKFTTLVENFKKAVNLAERISGRNITLPILSNIFIKTNKNKIYISATDLDLGIELVVAGKTEKEGAVVIPAKTLSSFLNNLTEEKVVLEQKDKNLRIKSGKYTTIFQGMNPEDFPIIPEVKTDKYIEIEKDLFKEALEQVIVSVSYSSPKPELNGVLLDLSSNNLKLVGTDSFRLSKKVIEEGKIKTNIKDELQIIVPLRCAQELLRILGEEGENNSLVKISPDPNQIQFTVGDIRLISRLINAQYPPYSSVIPQEFKNKIILSKDEMKEAVKVVGLFSGKINDIKLTIKPSSSELFLESRDPNVGQSSSVIKLEEAQGEGLEISFNYRYLLDGLNSIKEEKVFLGLNKETSPGVLRGKDNTDYIYILMPIKPV